MKFYVSYIIAVTLLLPIISIICVAQFFSQELSINLIASWFIFWAIGARLLSAGIVQVLKPDFTRKIMNASNHRSSDTFIRELGCANICIGLLALCAYFIPAWQTAAALCGGLFLGLCGFLHLLHWKKANSSEQAAMISDLIIFVMMIIIVTLYII